MVDLWKQGLKQMGKLEERAGLILSIVTTVLFCGAAFGVAQTQISHNREAIKTYEEDHDILLGVQADVKWIRDRLARDERLGLSGKFYQPPGEKK